MRKFIFLINPISGTADRKNLHEAVETAARKYDARYITMPTVASGDYDFVKHKIKEENFTDVIVCGGDGSVNSVVKDLKETKVNFGIIPLGSGNGLAFTAKIPKSTTKALDIVFTGKAAAIDGFMINQSFACMLCGLGFDAQVAHDFAKQNTRGLLTYAQQSIKNFFAAKPFSFDINLGDTRFSTEAFFISIANSNQFGNQVTIAPKASLSDGLLDLVVVRKMNKARLPVSLLAQIAGNNRISSHYHIKRTGIIYLQAHQFSIKNTDGAPLHIDGEPRETAKQFNIKVLPQCFKLIQPENRI